MAENFDFQITDIANAVLVLDYIVKQTPLKGWDNIRQLLALRDSIEELKIDYLIEQTVFQKWNNVRQIMALRDRLEMFVTSVAKATKLAETHTEQKEALNTSAPVLDRETEATAAPEAQPAAA